MEKKHFIFSCIFLFFLVVFAATGVTLYTNSKQLDESRRTNDQFREQLIRAEDTNRKLTEELEDCRGRIEQCQFILSDLDGLTTTNVRTIREAIELIEETRYEVGCLSYYLGCFDSTEYYDRTDNWLQSQGIEISN